MEAVRRRDTEPELALRRLLFARGYRYRVDHPLPVRRARADLVFTRLRLAVFVDGCFWHRCPLHGTSPKANGAWWARKLDENVVRDRRIDAALTELGWTVIRIWEHEPVETAASRVIEAVERLRDSNS